MLEVGNLFRQISMDSVSMDGRLSFARWFWTIANMCIESPSKPSKRSVACKKCGHGPFVHSQEQKRKKKSKGGGGGSFEPSLHAFFALSRSVPLIFLCVKVGDEGSPYCIPHPHSAKLNLWLDPLYSCARDLVVFAHPFLSFLSSCGLYMMTRNPVRAPLS